MVSDNRDGVIFREDTLREIGRTHSDNEDKPEYSVAGDVPQSHPHGAEVVFRNESNGLAVPAYGTMFLWYSDPIRKKQIGSLSILVRSADEIILTGRRWSQAGEDINRAWSTVAINGPEEVRKGGYGIAQIGDYAIAQFDPSASSLLVAGQFVGPAVDEDYLTTVGAAYRYLGMVADSENGSLAIVRRATRTGLLIRGPSGGIAGRDLVTMETFDELCDVVELDGIGAMVTQNTSRQPQHAIRNWTRPTVLANGDRYGTAAFHNGAWWVTSQDEADAAAFEAGSFSENAFGYGNPFFR